MTPSHLKNKFLALIRLTVILAACGLLAACSAQPSESEMAQAVEKYIGASMRGPGSAFNPYLRALAPKEMAQRSLTGQGIEWTFDLIRLYNHGGEVTDKNSYTAKIRYVLSYSINKGPVQEKDFEEKFLFKKIGGEWVATRI